MILRGFSGCFLRSRAYRTMPFSGNRVTRARMWPPNPAMPCALGNSLSLKGQEQNEVTNSTPRAKDVSRHQLYCQRSPQGAPYPQKVARSDIRALLRLQPIGNCSVKSGKMLAVKFRDPKGDVQSYNQSSGCLCGSSWVRRPSHMLIEFPDPVRYHEALKITIFLNFTESEICPR
jgi:hypothetical protein